MLHLKLLLSCFFTLITLSSHILAEEIPEYNEMIVTASHTPISIDEIGSSYTIITKEKIEKRQSIFVHELLRAVPGFSVSRSGVRGSQTQVRVRGAEANQLLVLIDGIEANDIASGDEFDFSNLLTTNIERIEIVRGPQSALYGSDAMAGVVNIITKKGKEALSISAFSEAGSFGTFHGGGSISGSGKRYNYNVAGSHISTAGNNISRQGNEDDRYENGTLSFNGNLKPIKNLSISVTARHVEAENETDSNTSAVTGLPIDTDSISEISRDYIGAITKLNLFDNAWEHKLETFFTSTENDNFTSGTETSSTQGKKIKFGYQTNLYYDLSDSLDLINTFTLALDYEKDLFTQSGPIGFGDPNQKQDAETMGYVLGYRANLWKRLFLSASVRKDDNSKFNDEVTYRTTAAYKIIETDARLHTSYATGFKRPTFTEMFGFFPGMFVGNPALKPETSKEWEFGFEQSLLSGRVNIAASYFNARLENEINTVFGAITTVTNLTGESRRQGIEIGTKVELFKNLNLVTAYTWLDATQPSAGAQIQEVRRPRNTGSLNLDYVLLNDKANINLNIDFNGSQDDVFFDPSIPPFGGTQRVNLGSSVLVNLAGSYKLNDSIKVNARVENVFDKEYEDVIGFQTTGIGAYLGINFSLNP